MLIVAAVVGGAVAPGLAVAVGALHTTAPTTRTVVQTTAQSATSAAPVADWVRADREANGGAVDITVSATRTVTTPFGRQPDQGIALGSGFVIDGAGDIATAAHVVAPFTADGTGRRKDRPLVVADVASQEHARTNRPEGLPNMTESDLSDLRARAESGDEEAVDELIEFATERRHA